MSDDVDTMLDDAAAALAEQTARPASAEQAAQTRARILASHRQSRAQSARAAVWLAAAAAVMLMLGGSTAWAYWTGRLDAWMGRAPVPTTIEPPPTTPPASTHVVPIAPPSSEDAPPAVTPEPLREVASQEASVAQEDTSEDEPSRTTTPSRPPVDPRERAAYREAHALHFDAHDPSDAVAAWDRYLASYPSGRFALEARYNRALCLVRLGRMSEARTALAPFVQGTHGGYRQHEATELVHALDAQ